MIFLSHSFAQQLREMTEPKLLFYKRNMAMSLQEAKESCVPMGEGCFHPQFGFIEDDKAEKKPIVEENTEVKTINALETNLVECREKEYFDIFCGKATPERKPAPIEVWVDISASMRNVDLDVTSKSCYRKTFVKNIIDQCPKDSVDVSVYNNSIKLIDTYDTACLSYGMNSPNRFKDWIEASTAEHLFVITDIDEMTQELRDFLDEKGANIVGIGAKDFSAKDLDSYVTDFLKTCKKK